MRHPTYFNQPIRSWGDRLGRLAIIGLAPGLHGANRTGRPFTGDHAGDLLFATLDATGFARGTYRADPTDGLHLVDARIVNAVRCVPPQNKPTPLEARTCRGFLVAGLAEMPNRIGHVALGRIAHDSLLAARGLRASRFPFAHGALHDLGAEGWLIDSYHCSRYNTNTGRLTATMFLEVFQAARARLPLVA